ncbi:hypothetical protein ART_3064 [Arthrobacter sp. PAMC 25486]|uniref:type II secretion system F family protein n=1 Tax=Arthrobacter sp. PAMC 25486 TaxID=1494608 RepID=UPI000535D2D7|nr:hypothetical protein [Arthrobacter sp. PAMC 25486]AIY02663.1 hypothetical protein ART_3064 [Arthrobacter sp. PAMC 25486]
MTALLIFALAATACALFGFHGRQWWAAAHDGGPDPPGRRARHQAHPVEALPRLVRQLAALLAAGRTGPTLWQSMAHVLAMQHERVQDSVHKKPRGSPAAPRPQRSNTESPGSRSMPGPGTSRDTDATLLLVISVQRASELGLPTATAIRASCHTVPTTIRRVGGAAGQGALTPEQRRLWLDIAACFEVCEASGAPVAAVLERLAGTLEADHDAAAQRETALAGPRATVRLLGWLPLVGLGLGMLMGVDPLGALLGSPIGWSVLAAGAGFAAVGRFWSARMIRHAAGPAPTSSRR